MTREEAIAEIKELTPELLREYRALAKELADTFGFASADEADADREEIDIEELNELYEGILEFAEGYDLDSVDLLLKQAEAYAIPEAEKERFDKVKRLVRDSDWEGLKELLA